MSADDAIFVQRNKAGSLVAQYGFMSDERLPDPEKAKISETFDRLAEVINARLAAASETEYGFEFIGDVFRDGRIVDTPDRGLGVDFDSNTSRFLVAPLSELG